MAQEVPLNDEKEKTGVFGAVAQAGIGIDSFHVMEPTLTEIFVEKAGDLNEAI